MAQQAPKGKQGAQTMPELKMGIGFDDTDEPSWKKRAKQQKNDLVDFSHPVNLYQACAEGRLSQVILNWAQGCELSQPDDSGFTPMMWAALQGRVQVIRFLADQGCSVNYIAPDGQTALMWAATENQLAAGKLLLELGADPFQIDRNGYNSYFVCVHQGNIHFLHMLCQHRTMDPTLTDNDGHHLTTWACYKGDFHILEYCHQVLGVPLDGKDATNRTALHWAAREGWDDCVRYCIGQGLSTTDKDDEGCSPYDHAFSRGHEDTSAIIKGKMGEQEETVVGSMKLISTSRGHLFNCVFAVLYFIGHFAWSYFILPVWAHMPVSAYFGKNMIHHFLRKSPVRHSVPETSLADDIGAPKTVMGALRGPVFWRRREVSNMFAAAALVCVQYYIAVATEVPIHPLFIPLALGIVFFGFLAKMNPHKNVIPRGTAKDDPCLLAVEKGEYNSLHPRILNEKLHVRVPLRAFYCQELDRIVKRYDSWSVLLDCPITNINHRSFFFCILCFFLLEALTFWTSYQYLSERYCNSEDAFSMGRLAWNMLFSNLPCAMKPLSDSWKDWWFPQPHNVAGAWLLSYTFPTAGFAFTVLLRQFVAIINGVTRAELSDRTAPTINGDLESIIRSDRTMVFSEGSKLANLMMWLSGKAGNRWEDVAALPSTNRPAESKP